MFEFLDQYEPLPWYSKGSTLLGIGVAVKMEYLDELNNRSGGQYGHLYRRATNLLWPEESNSYTEADAISEKDKEQFTLDEL